MTSDLRDQLQKTLGGAYTLDRELGGGGMSRVFVAIDTALDRRVVVKVLPDEMAAAVSLERFKREITFAARLQHPHIVPLLSAGATDGLPYFTMPFVEGESLRSRLSRGGELPVADGVRMLREIASALDYAHEQGVVHRDIKPDNVLLSRGSSMVSDFGVAKALSASTSPGSSGMTSMGVALGTPAYMSPEQAAASGNIDARADIYAFGVMAYEMFTGHVPFSGRSPQAMLAAHVTEAPEQIQRLRPALPPALAALIMRCLEKHPADRPQQASDIMQSLDAITTPSAGVEPTGTSATARATPTRRMYVALALIAVAVVVLAVTRPWSASATAPVKSIAVLPFENTGGDTAGAYFADGMRDEIATALGKVPSLSVASRTSSYAFRGKPGVTLKAIGTELGVDAILEGTVRRSGDQLRISAQLTRASTGLGLWSDSYNRKVTDVFAVQEELAKAIAATLGAAVSGDGRATPVSVARSRGTDNQAAYDLYLRGRHLLNARRELSRAREFLERAVGLDTAFSQAFAAAATVNALMPFYEGVSAPDALRRTRVHADRALALDGTLAEPHAALGFALAQTYAWADAEREFQRAIALDSMSATAFNLYGFMLLGIGRTEDGVRTYERAVKLDPLSPVATQNYSMALNSVGQSDSALAIARRMLEVDPSASQARRALAAVSFRRNDWKQAALELERAAPSAASAPELVLAYTKLGRRREADSVRAVIERRAATTGRSTDVFEAYVALGDKPNALRWLKRAIDRYDGGILSAGLFTSFKYTALRGDPEFERLLARLGVQGAQGR